jgi:sulfatase maturation enzyme AslB (radical SAM superfamily)
MAQDYAVINVEPVDAKIRQSCKNCVKYEFCQEICPEVEALLPKKTTGKHKKEITVSTEYVESLGVQRAFKLKYGKKYDIFKHESDF